MRSILSYIKFIFLILVMFIHYSSFSQDRKKEDNFNKRIKEEKTDTGKINVYIQLSDEYKGEQPDSALLFLNKALSLCLGMKDNTNKFTANSLNKMGGIYYLKGDYGKAMDAFVRSIEIHEKINDQKGIASCASGMGLIYYEQGFLEKAKDYFNRSFRIYDSMGSKKDVAACYNNLGLVFFEEKNYNKAIECYSNSLKIRKELNDRKGMSKCFTNIGNVYSSEKNYKKALEFYQKSLKIKESLNDKNGIATVLVNISEMNILTGKYNDAINYANKSLEIGKSIKSLMLQRDNYENLSIAYDSLRNYEKAFRYQVLFKQVYDSIFNKDKSDKIAELQTKYETEKKQRDIEKLQNEKESQELKIRQSRIIILFVIIGSVLLLIIGLSLLNMYKQNQSKRKILTAIVETEEKEKKRFAEDLHDGLGPLLSGAKLSINELQSEKHSPEKKDEFFKMANDLIKESIKNTRMIANNLMPGVLGDYGLINALETFCAKIEKTGAVKILIDTDIHNKRYNAIIEITLYRVILELINNTLKHAAASTINIKIYERDKYLNVSYSDNGKGFELQKIMNDAKKGLGLNNVINRIKTIDGKCEFKSEPDKGTLALIEVNYKK
ncbi:MAG: sensor histidine kinase [Bacteroidales bacterium]|nr:sensor histidine kinase [Bacteroidales bacterium]